MSDMIIDDNDTFLPTDSDKLKAQIKLLKERLTRATEKQKKLKKELLEEDISYLVVSKLTNAFTDPTVVAKKEMSNAKQEIFRQMREAVKSSCIQELISYHRLSGRTTFRFKKKHIGVRLETFYGKTYKEPYYLLFLKSNPSKVDKHTIPTFISVNDLERKFLPNNYETFIRIIHDCVQAYVSRREQINEVANLSKEYDIKILTENKAKSHFEMKAHINHHTRPILISMDYANKASAYPTQVKLTDERGTVSLNEYQETEELLLTSHHLADTLRSILQRIEI
ncbi:hypothetical protein G6F43_009777 [Rhizopus delemar]|nr:hypothetical protein G6F43_009777 [Rhizopus delemar]